MNSLQQILESILDSDFDVTEKDLNFVQEFVQKYKSNSKISGSYYIKNGWDWKGLGKIVNKYYGRSVGRGNNSDLKVELNKIRNNNESLLIISDLDSSPAFYILVPQGRKNEGKWMIYANDQFWFRVTLFKGIEYTDNEILKGSWTGCKSYVYALQSDKLLRDFQDELK